MWCKTCNDLPNPVCNQENHDITDILSPEVQEVNSMLDEVENGAEASLNKRGEEERPLLAEQDQLKAKLKAVEAQVKENEDCKERLCHQIVVQSKKLKLLSAAKKATVFVKKNVEEKLKEVKEQAKLAEQFTAVRRNSVFIHQVYRFIS